MLNNRTLTDLVDERLVNRGNTIMGDLFRKHTHSIRQISGEESKAKATYRFLNNERITESDIERNLISNCRSACRGKSVVCIQDTTEINLSSHSGRIKRDDYIGTTNGRNDYGIGFFLHPSFVLDAEQGIPYGFSAVKMWNRSLEFTSKQERDYGKLPIEDKESYKWIEVSNRTKASLSDVVNHMVIIQDREGDIFDQFAMIPDMQTDLLIRASHDRRLAGNQKLFSCLSGQEAQGSYQIFVPAKGKRKARDAKIEIRFRKVTLLKPSGASKDACQQLELNLVEAKETGSAEGRICWRLLTTIEVDSVEMAKSCIEWYSWRWTIEEVFKILKKEGYNIEASELETAGAIRKLSLLIMESIIKLFLMRLAYAEPEMAIAVETCFDREEQEFIEHQIVRHEGKTEKQRNPYGKNDLKRYLWLIARLGGWKGYESKRHPGLTTLMIGMRYFYAAMQGWSIHKEVSTR